jgi:hypothetical protein
MGAMKRAFALESSVLRRSVPNGATRRSAAPRQARYGASGRGVGASTAVKSAALSSVSW